MKTLFLKPTDDLQVAADIIKNGGLVAFPTETVYGLGASALDENAAKKIYEAKGRPSDNPLIIHLAKPEDAEKYAQVSKEFNILADNFMPGPITVILPKKDIIPKTVTGGLDTVAIRIPSNKIANKLISLSGVPIAAPSANISGRPSCTEFSHVVEDMDSRIDAIIDGGECEIGLESTIVSIVGDMELKLLRPGGITPEMLIEAGFSLSLDKAVTEKLDKDEMPLAPGMKYRHYSPKASVILLDGNAEKIKDFLYEKSNDDSCAVILFDEEKNNAGKNAYFIGNQNDEDKQARTLFSLLRSFDKNPKIKTVYSRVSDKNGIGLAIYNRMIKASGYTIINID